MSKITQSAKNEECQVRLYGVCNFNSATVVWAHANGSASGKGMGLKSPDALGTYACSACHDAIDGRTKPKHLEQHEIKIAFHEGHQRSFIKLMQKGLVTCL